MSTNNEKIRMKRIIYKEFFCFRNNFQSEKERLLLCDLREKIPESNRFGIANSDEIDEQ